MSKLAVGVDLADIIEINPIYFDFDKANIRPDAALELDKIVQVLNDYPGMVIELGSHTDCRGNDDYNVYLSDRRAKSSAAYVQERIKIKTGYTVKVLVRLHQISRVQMAVVH